MDAHKLWLLRDFIGANKVLFKIPVYQRNYDWSESNCNRLLDDVSNIIATNEKHFLGTIVFMSAGSGGFALQEYIIIDGQQRLTTMMIMLKALAELAKATGDSCYEEINDTYLHNKYCAEEFKVKLKPIKSDNEQFLLLLKDNFEDMDEDSHIYKNYFICKERFEKWIQNGIAPSQILEALTKLELVEIVLTKGEDDPQIIFESINSTGLELSNSDLIRNFLLMSEENQDKLYESYWLKIENALKNKSDYTYLDLFFMQYILYKTSKPVNSKRLYELFVKLFKDGNYSHEVILQELYYYAKIFKAFIFGSDDYPEQINSTLLKIRILNQTTCYPFLFHVFDDYNKHVISVDQLQKVIDLILSYLLRRLVCGVPSNTLRGLFTYLYNRIFKVESNKHKYYEAINKFLFTVTSKDVIPSATEFNRCLVSANIYGNPALCKFLLSDIENGDNKETILVDSLTIEHIMPQTLSADWSYITEEEHEQFLHTLGNLSITGYNSELSNKSFTDKKAIIQEYSKAVILNQDIIDKDSWDIKCIKDRANRLAKIISERYKIDMVVDESIEFEYVQTISLDNYNDITGKKLVTFKFLDNIYRQNYYAFMLLDIIKLLDKIKLGQLEKLAEIGYSININKKHVHINTDGLNMRIPQKIKDDVYVELNLSAVGCVKFIECLLHEYGISAKEFSFNIVAEEPEDDNVEISI